MSVLGKLHTIASAACRKSNLAILDVPTGVISTVRASGAGVGDGWGTRGKARYVCSAILYIPTELLSFVVSHVVPQTADHLQGPPGLESLETNMPETHGARIGTKSWS